MTKQKHNMPIRIKVWAVFIVVISFVIVFWALVSPDEKWPVSLIIPLMIVAFGIPFLPYLPEWIEEIGGMGFTIKTRKAIQTVQHRQLVNKVVAIHSNGPWYWIDEAKIPHKLPDKETAQFLASLKELIFIDSTELDQLQPVDVETFPSIKDATPARNGNDIFILYHDTLYYQSSLGYLYKLAAWKGFDFRGKNIGTGGWDKELNMLILTTEIIDKYRVV